MMHLPSPLYFSFSLCIEALRSWKLFTSPLQTMTILFSLSHALFCIMLLVHFILLTSTLSHQCTQSVTVQITAAFIGTNHNPIQLLSAGLGFSEGSCGRAGCRPIETCLVVQPGLPQGGVKNRNRLWKFTDSLKISWLLAKSENSQYNKNNCF